MQISEYPRVLVINGEPFWQGSATGITMTKLFMGWPKEKLACLFMSKVAPDFTMCERYWKLRRSDLRSVRVLLGSFATSNAKAIKPEGILDVSLRGKDNQFRLLISSILKRLRQYIAGTSMGDLDVFRVPDHIMKQIDEFKPQVIYNILSTNPVMQLVLDFSYRYSISIVPHFFDDWPTTLYQSSIFRSRLRSLMQAKLSAVLERSPKRLVIGTAMAIEYIQRYGGDFIPFMNAIEPEDFVPTIQPRPRKLVRMIHIGRLQLNRWRSLRDIGLTLKELYEEGLEVELLIYCQQRVAEKIQKLDIPPVVRFAGSLESSAEVYRVIRDADILVHVDSFENTDRQFFRYSVSTKIPEYMAAARPIFAYGPEELASIRYIRDSGAGIVVDKQDSTALKTALRELADSDQLRRQLGENGYRVAVNTHDARLQREQFRSILECVATHKTTPIG